MSPPSTLSKVTKNELMLMSLVEKLARRVRSSPELMAGIAKLKERGYGGWPPTGGDARLIAAGARRTMFTRAMINKACDDASWLWAHGDRVLYDLCRSHPRHGDERALSGERSQPKDTVPSAIRR